MAKLKDSIVRRLLWEIHRLRVIALRADQIIRADYRQDDVDNSVREGKQSNETERPRYSNACVSDNRYEYS
jgi:hypothetical protein